jgi:hypothetical protein
MPPTLRVSPSAVLESACDGTGDWTVTDDGALELRAPLDGLTHPDETVRRDRISKTCSATTWTS